MNRPSRQVQGTTSPHRIYRDLDFFGDAGARAQLLIPQLNAEVLRCDWAFPFRGHAEGQVGLAGAAMLRISPGFLSYRCRNATQSWTSRGKLGSFARRSESLRCLPAVHLFCAQSMSRLFPTENPGLGVVERGGFFTLGMLSRSGFILT